MVVLLLSALLQSRVTPRDRLRQPLSPLCIVFHLPSLLRCFPSSSLLQSCSPSIKQYKLFVIFLTLLNLVIPLASLAHFDSQYFSTETVICMGERSGTVTSKQTLSSMLHSFLCTSNINGSITYNEHTLWFAIVLFASGFLTTLASRQLHSCAPTIAVFPVLG